MVDPCGGLGVPPRHRCLAGSDSRVRLKPKPATIASGLGRGLRHWAVDANCVHCTALLQDTQSLMCKSFCPHVEQSSILWSRYLAAENNFLPFLKRCIAPDCVSSSDFECTFWGHMHPIPHGVPGKSLLLDLRSHGSHCTVCSLRAGDSTGRDWCMSIRCHVRNCKV
jgi:hypothetical protein